MANGKMVARYRFVIVIDVIALTTLILVLSLGGMATGDGCKYRFVIVIDVIVVRHGVYFLWRVFRQPTLILRFSLREKGHSRSGRGPLLIAKFPLPQGEG